MLFEIWLIIMEHFHDFLFQYLLHYRTLMIQISFVKCFFKSLDNHHHLLDLDLQEYICHILII